MNCHIRFRHEVILTSDVQEIEIWFGTFEDNLSKDVTFEEHPEGSWSIPFLGGGV